MTDDIKNRIHMLASRVIINDTDDSDELQTVKFSGSSDEEQDGVDRLQPYGITSRAPNSSEGVALFFNGDRSDGIVLTVDSAEYRIKDLSDGEVCIYSKHGQTIKLKSNGDIDINANTNITGDLTVNGEQTETGNKDIIGNLTVTGDLSATGAIHTLTGSTSCTVKSPLATTITGTTTLKMNGATVAMEGGNIAITATGTLDLNGATVNINGVPQ